MTKKRLLRSDTGRFVEGVLLLRCYSQLMCAVPEYAKDVAIALLGAAVGIAGLVAAARA